MDAAPIRTRRAEEGLLALAALHIGPLPWLLALPFAVAAASGRGPFRPANLMTATSTGWAMLLVWLLGGALLCGGSLLLLRGRAPAGAAACLAGIALSAPPAVLWIARVDPFPASELRKNPAMAVVDWGTFMRISKVGMLVVVVAVVCIVALLAWRVRRGGNPAGGTT